MDGYIATARAAKASRVADTLDALADVTLLEALARAKAAVRAADLTPEEKSRLLASLEQTADAAGQCAGQASGRTLLPALSFAGSGAVGKGGPVDPIARPPGASLEKRAKSAEPGLFVTYINFALTFADALRSREAAPEIAARWRELAALLRRARLTGVTCQLMAAYAGERKKSPDRQAAKTILARSLHELDGIVSGLTAFYGDASCPDCGLAAVFAHTTISRLLPETNAR